MRVYFFVFLFFLFFSCAKMGVISGGEKDTIPPVLVSSIPPLSAINVSGKDFSFLFDEVIDAEEIQEKLIVSPYINAGFESSIKKNYLVLSFDSVFEKDRTYILNFADGIKDITEGNAAKSLKYVFSTGSVIDSLFVVGRVVDPLTNELKKDVLVALYDKKDSLGLFLNKPLYFDYTDDFGSFKIENIKKDSYSLYAFEDKNMSFKAEPDKEGYAFLSSSVQIKEGGDSVFLPLIKQNLLPLKLVRSRKRGHYYEATYSKSLSKIEIESLESKTLNYSLNDNNKTLRFYPDSSFLETDSSKTDSLLVVVKATDSLLFFSKDSLFVSFSESKRPKKEFKVSGYPLPSSILNDSVFFNLLFTKPVVSFNKNLLLNRIDTLYKKPVKIKDHVWNKNKTSLRFKLLYKKDSFKIWKKRALLKLKKDSLFYDSDSLYSSHYNYLNKLDLNKISFFAEYGAFVSVEKDTLKTSRIDFTFKEAEYYGKVSGRVNASFENFFIQLVTKDFKLVFKNRSANKETFLFENIPPGTYFLRVFIDENENLLWDKGNILKNKEPERIFFLKTTLEVRSNWQIEDVLFEF